MTLEGIFLARVWVSLSVNMALCTALSSPICICTFIWFGLPFIIQYFHLPWLLSLVDVICVFTLFSLMHNHGFIVNQDQFLEKKQIIHIGIVQQLPL